MKLLFCPSCYDLFKLPYTPIGRVESRRCLCGLVSGRYINESDAEVNGEGISIAIGNGSLQLAIQRMRELEKSGRYADRKTYQNEANIHYAWVRPHEGPGNPHTRVRKE